MRAYATTRTWPSFPASSIPVVLLTWVSRVPPATAARSWARQELHPFTLFPTACFPCFRRDRGRHRQPHGASRAASWRLSEIALTYPYKKFLQYLLPEDLHPDGLVQLLSTDYKLSVSFVILVMVLLWRPTGLFGGRLS